MFSIEIDKNIITDVTYESVNLLYPHEKIINKKKNFLKEKFLNTYGLFFISSIIICNESGLIIDGHHRYFALKELGFKKAPVTLIDYQSDSIRTGSINPLDKKYIVDIGNSSDLLEPKSTEHAVYCNNSKSWEPIILLSSMFKINTKEIT